MLSNLPPGCTQHMIDELIADEFECVGCGERLDEDETCECDACGSFFCRQCIGEIETGTGYLCEGCRQPKRQPAGREEVRHAEAA